MYDRLTGNFSYLGSGEGSSTSISHDNKFISFETVNGVYIYNLTSGTYELISVSSGGTTANSSSGQGRLSGDGRYVVFVSYATNLVQGDTNGKNDIFVRDRVNGTTSRVSVSSNGVQANGSSTAPTISADGRYVVFVSDATNLVPNDTNVYSDVFIRDTQTGETRRINSTSGVQGNGASDLAYISGDGRSIVFRSAASNLVEGDTNGKPDIFTYNLATGEIRLVSKKETNASWVDGSSNPSISYDGKYVAFSTYTKLIEKDYNSFSDIYMETQEVAAEEPKTEINVSGTLGNNGWYNSDVQITLTPVNQGGITRTEYSLNNIDWTTYTVPFTISTNGISTVYYRSVDNAGKFETAKNLNLNIDKVSPVTTVVQSGTLMDNGWYGSSVQVTMTAADNTGQSGLERTEYSFNGTDWITYTAPFTISTNGISTIHYRSIDNAGNIESTKTESFKVDSTAPVTNVTLDGTLGNNGWYISDVKVTMTASDNQDGSGVAKTEYSLDGTNWITYSEPFMISAEGATTLYCRSVDNAGNTEIVQQEEEINVDVTAPTTEAVYNSPSGSGGWTNTSGQVTLTLQDSGGGSGGTGGSGGSQTEYSLDGENWIPYDGPISIAEEGTHTIFYRSVDSAGNKETPKKIIIKIDKTPPVTTIVLKGTLGNDGWYVSDVQVVIAAEDNADQSGVAKTEYSFNGTDWITYTTPFTISANGISTIHYRSVDNAGNIESTKTVSFKIDKTAPVTNVTLDGTLGNNGWYVSDVKVTMTASDNKDGSGVAKTEYSLDGTNWITYSEPFIISAEGATTLYYRSVDNAGNTEMVQQEEKINVDVNAPTTAAVFNRPSGNGQWANESGQVTLNIEDTGSGGGQTEYSLDGENWIPYDGPINIEEEGTHTIYYRSEDGAGNKETPKKIIIKIDKTAPMITGEATTAPNDNGWYNGDVTVRFTASDGVSGIDTVTPDTTITTEGVDQSVTGTAKDKAGNTESYTVTGINIDKTLPQISINIPTEGAEYTLGQTVLTNWSTSDSLSGIDSAVGTVASGEPIDTATVGLKTFTVVAEDKAGNRTEKTVSYRVVYIVEINLKSSDGKTHKLGSTIPVKFTLKDANGSLVTNASGELYVANIVDGKAGEEQKASSTSSAASGNLFRYDNTDGQYIFNLSTKELSAGTWQLRIALDDNTSINFTITLR